MKCIKKICHHLLWILPKSLVHKIFYYRQAGKKLDLKNPKDINEKVHYMMVYKYGKEHGKLADKYKVREFIKEKGYENILPKLYGIYNDASEINSWLWKSIYMY